MINMLELYQNAGMLAKIGVWEYNLISKNLYWDYVVKSIHEVEPNFVPSLEGAIDFYYEESDRELIRKLVNAAILSGRPYAQHFRIKTAKGNIKWIETTGQAEFIGNSCLRVFGSFQDITNERNLIETLKLNEEKFHHAFDLAPIGMALVSPEGNWIKVNKSICRLLGYSEEELMELTFQDITHPDDLELDLANVQQMLDKKIEAYQMEKRYFNRDGQIIWVLLSASLVWKDETTPLYFISQIKDINDRKLMHEALHKERQQLSGIIEGTNVGTWEWNVITGATVFNERWAEISGFELAELGATNIDLWCELTHPDDVQAVKDLLDKCFNKEETYYDMEYRMLHKAGHWVWVHDRGKVVTWDENGRPLIMLGTHADITQRKIDEEERKKAFATVSEQNNRLLNFAHIVSHNLRSHASNFQQMLELLEHETDEREKQELIQLLKKNALNLRDTIHNLNDVVNIQTKTELEFADLNLHDELQKTISHINQIISDNEAIVSNRVPRDFIVRYNPAYLESILLNFLTNALRYKHDARRPMIDIQVGSDGQFDILSIKDNGLGIDLNRYGEKLFGMYKTFHNHPGAQGIGLFITKSQVEAMGGKIIVESEPGQGSTFHVYIKK